MFSSNANTPKPRAINSYWDLTCFQNNIIIILIISNHGHTADENLEETGGNTYLCTKLFIRDSHSSQNWEAQKT